MGRDVTKSPIRATMAIKKNVQNYEGIGVTYPSNPSTHPTVRTIDFS